MADALNPSGPAQPDLADAYTAPQNPATKEPREQDDAASIANDNSTTDTRIPATQATYSQATPTSMARGVHGVDPDDYANTEGHNGPLTADGRTTDDHSQTDQMQMGAPGEGKVADAVRRKPGAGAGGGESGGFGEGAGLEEGLERKKAEQAEARARVDGTQSGEFDKGGEKGQRGGPANPVDRQGPAANYPNAGSDY